jgi:hypothetical protein
VTESSKERGEGAACSRVGCSPFIGAGEHQGGGGRVVTFGVMALIAIDGGAGLRLGIQGGDVKAGSGISRLRAGRVGWPRAAGIHGGVARLGEARTKETKLTGGACVSASKDRESVEDRRRKPKRKTYFERTPMAHRPDGPAERGGSLRAR